MTSFREKLKYLLTKLMPLSFSSSKPEKALGYIVFTYGVWLGRRMGGRNILGFFFSILYDVLRCSGLG